MRILGTTRQTFAHDARRNLSGPGRRPDDCCRRMGDSLGVPGASAPRVPLSPARPHDDAGPTQAGGKRQRPKSPRESRPKLQLKPCLDLQPSTPEDPDTANDDEHHNLFYVRGIVDHFTLKGSLVGWDSDVLVEGRRLRKEQEIGRGRYGCVDLMTHPTTGIQMAVKRIRESTESQDTKYLDREIRACREGGACPFLIQCFGVMRLEGDIWICMELMEASLDRFYRTCEDRQMQIPHFVLARITYSIVKGLQFLADELCLMHRDVKPSNVLCSHNGKIKVCDYGVSGTLESHPMQKTINAGHKAYMAPERITQDHDAYQAYDERSDVWSLGISLFEMGSGHHPYENWKNPFQQLRQVVIEPAPKLSPADPRFSDEFKDFVHACLNKDYDARPKYAALLEHPFLVSFLEKEPEWEESIVRFVSRVLDAIDETINGLTSISISKHS